MLRVAQHPVHPPADGRRVASRAHPPCGSARSSSAPPWSASCSCPLPTLPQYSPGGGSGKHACQQVLRRSDGSRPGSRASPPSRGAALWGPAASAHGVEPAGSIGHDGWLRGDGYEVRLVPNWYAATQSRAQGLIVISFPFDGAKIGLLSPPASKSVKAADLRNALLQLGARPALLGGAPGPAHRAARPARGNPGAMVHRPRPRGVPNNTQQITRLPRRLPLPSRLPYQNAPHLALDEDWVINGPSQTGSAPCCTGRVPADRPGLGRCRASTPLVACWPVWPWPVDSGCRRR